MKGLCEVVSGLGFEWVAYWGGEGGNEVVMGIGISWFN